VENGKYIKIMEMSDESGTSSSEDESKPWRVYLKDPDNSKFVTFSQILNCQ
jgi:hypothetical protein